MMPYQLRPARTLFACLLIVGVVPARAALPDEIQVYLDDLNDAGRYSLQMHLNATPSGVAQPDYPGESVAAGGQRATAEFAYGVTPDLEAGLYVPLVRESFGGLRLPGLKLRLKWVPLRPPENASGTFLGLNGELAQVQHQFDSASRAFELRPILGWRNPDWMVAVNPVLEFPLEGPDRHQAPDFSPSFKVARTLAAGISTGAEYYAELGAVNQFDRLGQQKHTLYWAIDIDRSPWNVNFGIGRGLTAVTDRWTVKAIVNIPLGQ